MLALFSPVNMGLAQKRDRLCLLKRKRNERIVENKSIVKK